MKKIIPFILLALFAFTSKGFSQFDQPMLQIGIGIAEPMDQLKGGNYWILRDFVPPGGGATIQATTIDTSFMMSNLAAKTGFNIFGSGKINFDKYNIVRGVGYLAFNSFNAFQSNVSGNQIDGGYNINNQFVYNAVPVKYNYSVTTISLGLGIEIAPTSFTGVVSPFFGANLAFNNFTSTLERTFNNFDTSRATMSGFRIGVNFNAGIEAKFSPQFGIALGVKYDLGNLLMKSNSNGNITETQAWGSTNGVINDDEGQYTTKLPNFLYDGFYRTYNSQKKNLNWGTIYLAVNFYPNAGKTSTTKKK